MKVILYTKIENLGNGGDIISVKKGFARNYLFPRKLAMEATPSGIKQWEYKKRAVLAKEGKAHRKAIELSEKLEKLSFTVSVKVGEQEQMFGSVTNADLEEILQKEGIKIDRKDILLQEPIRELGVYTVPLRLHPQVKGKIKVWVVKE